MGAADESELPEHWFGDPDPRRLFSPWDWPVPPPCGITAHDLDKIPYLPRRVELIDGAPVFGSPQNLFHARTLSVLQRGLGEQVPERLRVARQMSVILGPRQRPDPDVAVVDAAADRGDDQTYYPAASVLLVIEVVSRDSEVRDRERKPQLYAQAGIAHFWRVEREAGDPVVYVYELDPATRSYVATGIHRRRLRLGVPFDVDIDLLQTRFE
ncbi:Uma2 family endonuclease [Streptomonospora litoralis]|uniref:Putative restriction endonuclease domain-containing protein n=1 Tax=Streptomonospora litoralis TaxID=2498135 RepID=A0A4P6Q8S4_9ACTN|nr:Uma2 family endonuclease [Streptomonospora litoralis]QBI55921.1 hypothetical protein EKD16_20810 [Streptomonospora litoralis]